MSICIVCEKTIPIPISKKYKGYKQMCQSCRDDKRDYYGLFDLRNLINYTSDLRRIIESYTSEPLPLESTSK